MSRYIDADALLNRLRQDLPYKASVKRVLIQAPTADVVEVRHGAWIPSKYHYGFYLCSECGRHVEARRDDPEVPYPYCHCGAKMDGERREK